MVEVGGVDHHAQQSANDTDAQRLADVCVLLFHHGIHDEGQYHQEDDEQVVVCHLYVVGMYLKGAKEGGNQQSPEVFLPEGQDDTANHRRQIGQRHHLPQVSGSDDNQEIGAEGPEHGAQCGQLLTEIEGTQQDVEAQQVHEQVPHIIGQPQMVGILHLRQQVGTVV